MVTPRAALVLIIANVHSETGVGQVAGFHFFIIFLFFFFFSVPRALVVGLFALILAQLNCAFYEAGNSYLQFS